MTTNWNCGEKASVMKQLDPISLDAVAGLFGRTEPASRDAGALLAGTTVVLDGFGSIARPLSEELARLGARRFVLIDPKCYAPESVHSQCAPEEVGRLKVDVGAEQLRALGAEVVPYARDISSVPEGVVTPAAIVITTFDNRRADIRSNRRAVRMGARLIKLNVEPALDVVALRAYDFRRRARVCVECQFGDHHYAAQRHPKSCDGSFDGRRTNSPRWLSRAAAQLGVLATLDLAADGAAAPVWLDHEWQYLPKTGRVRRSRLEPKPHCLVDHTQRWQNVVRLQEGAAGISLRDLIEAAGVAVDARVVVRFCQQVALLGRCGKCHIDVAVVRWISDLQAPVGACPACGGSLAAFPFDVRSEASLEPLLTVLDEPLAQWGVEQFAVIEIARGERRVTFVVGGG
jgi:hypothetical protein